LVDWKELSKSKTDDVLIISCLGNNMVTNKVGGDPIVKRCNKRFSVVDAVILGSETMAELMGTLTCLINKVSKSFKGWVKVLGPPPRYISPCCDLEKHKIRDPQGNIVRMQNYIQGVNGFFEQQQSLNMEIKGGIYLMEMHLWRGGWSLPTNFTLVGQGAFVPECKQKIELLHCKYIRKEPWQQTHLH